MARFTRLQVLNRMVESGLVPVFYHEQIDTARNVVRAVAESGCRLMEFTNRGDHAWEVFTALESFCRAEIPDMMLGVGSIVDPATAALYINCGAAFVVSPVLNADVARTCNRRKVACSPGCATPSEIGAAEELGCEIVKIFPGAEVGGPSFVKNLRAPCPWTSIMPTGGVDPTEESLRAWFAAGAVCVGMGSKLITRELVKKGDWAGITRNVRDALELIRGIRA